MKLRRSRSYLAILVGPVAFALPQTLEDGSLPPQLATVLPLCSRSCVSTVIDSAFLPSGCSAADDFRCLCSRRSTAGLTMGEVGLQCLASSCSSTTRDDQALSQRVYRVCEGQEGALPNTHSVLTATATAPAPSRTTGRRPSVNANVPVLTDRENSTTTSARSTTGSSARPTESQITSSTSRPSSTTEASTRLSTRLSTASPPSTVTSTWTSYVVSTPPQPSDSQAAVPEAASRPLTREQIAGVCVGIALGVIALSMAGLALYLKCGGARRKRRGETSGFNVLNSPRPGDGKGKGKREWYGASSVPTGSEQRPKSSRGDARALPKLTTTWPPEHPDPIGAATSPESKKSQPTPRTGDVGIFRSDSTLLPDKPAFPHAWPAPPRWRPYSEATLIEDDGRPVDDVSVGSSSCHTSLGWPTSYYSPDFESDDPHLRGYQYARHMSNPPIVPPPAPPTESYMARLKRERAGSLGSQTDSPPLPDKDHRRGSGGRMQAARGSRGSRLRHSAGSVTSFETQDDQAEAEHDGPLTPVREMYEDDDKDDQMVSPISPERLKYPAIPRSLSGSVRKRGPPPRPPSSSRHRGTLHPSTAATSRRPPRPRPAPPAPPPLLRNDTYSRNEDLVIATTQALTEVTGSSEFTKQTLLREPASEEDLEKLHLADEGEWARQGLALMRERGALPAADIHGTHSAGNGDRKIEVQVKDPSSTCPKGTHLHTSSDAGTAVTIPLDPGILHRQGQPHPHGLRQQPEHHPHGRPRPAQQQQQQQQPAEMQRPRNLENPPDWIPRLTAIRKDGDLCLVLDPSSSSSSSTSSTSKAAAAAAGAPSASASGSPPPPPSSTSLRHPRRQRRR